LVKCPSGHIDEYNEGLLDSSLSSSNSQIEKLRNQSLCYPEYVNFIINAALFVGFEIEYSDMQKLFKSLNPDIMS